MLTLPPIPVRAGDRVAVAVSGGADSIALLFLVHAARGRLGVGVSAVHVNHSLRGEESDGDQQFVEALCERLGVPVRTLRVDTAGHAGARRLGIEEAARNLRYDEFRRMLAAGEAQVVLTAHTLDDQAETVLMKLLRGAWTEGLGAISPVLEVPGGRIVRPLLGTARAALRTFLRESQEAWREDSSNSDEAFTRNRIRHTVLPVLRAENPSIDRTLGNLAEVAREEEARWTGELARLLPQLILPGKPVRGGGRANSTAPGESSLALELERLKTMDGALRRRVVRAAARQLGCRLSFDETERVLCLCGFAAPDATVPSKAGGKVALAGGLVAERSVRELRLTRRPPAG